MARPKGSGPTWRRLRGYISPKIIKAIRIVGPIKSHRDNGRHFLAIFWGLNSRRRAILDFGLTRKAQASNGVYQISKNPQKNFIAKSRKITTT